MSDIHSPESPEFKRLFRFMRKSAFCLCLGSMSLMAGNVYAQSAKVSIHRENVQMETILGDIEAQTDYLFVYKKNVNVKLRKTVQVNNQPVSSVLSQILADSDYTYKMEGNHIVLMRKEESVRQQSSGVKTTVKGKVVDSTGEPVIGATVKEKGTTNGTITDFDGNFALNVVDGSLLEVSFVGYKSQQIKTQAGKELKITLKDDNQILDEVVVVGFGTQKKVNLTGAVGVVQADELASRPVANVTQALQGMVPGLQISTTSGDLDESMSINIRGTATIGEGSTGSPLILIDGMEGDINALNPQDIENISVLKDASSTSIYGSRAPFGVILITTKSGKKGKTSISYNNSFRWASPINLPEMMDSYTFANYFNSANQNSGQSVFFSFDVMQKMLDFQSGKLEGALDVPSDGLWGKPSYDPFTAAYGNTNWYDELYKGSVFSQEHNVSASGGNDKISYYTALGYLNQGGLLRHGDDGAKRYNLTAKINANLTDWLKLSYGLRFIRRDSYKPSQLTNDLYNVIGRQTWPNLPVYDPNGYYFDCNADTPAMRLALGGESKTKTDRIYHQGALIIEPLKNWITHAEFNYSTYRTATHKSNLAFYNHDVDGNIVNTNKNSSIYESHLAEDYMNINLYSEYSHTFKEVHNAKIMLGFQAENLNQDFMDATKYGIIMDDMPEFDLTTGLGGTGEEMTSSIGGHRHSWSTAGFFGRVNYDFQGKYLAEASVRYDGSSRFRSGHRWQFSPSFSLGWNISHENFWQPIADVVNTLKLRMSYGESGNQNTNDWYPTYEVMKIQALNGYWLQNGKLTNTAVLNALVSQNLTWETIRSWNLGLDFGLFENRLQGSFDIYTRFTDNMVGPAPELPNILGVAVPKVNNCDLKTAGWELELGWNDRLDNGFGYGIKAVLSDAQTTIRNYPGNATNSVDTYATGHVTGEIWEFETIGIAKTQEEMDQHLQNVGGQPFGSKWGAGDIMYADLDGKAGITEGSRTYDDHGDLKVIGNNTPRYHIGLDLQADWKGIDFRCFFQGVLKRDYWQGSNMFWGVTSDIWQSTGLNEHSDYFRSEPIGLPGYEIAANLDAYYPRPLIGRGSDGPSKNQKVQTRYLQNAAYLRMKNLSVGYTFPVEWTNKWGISKFRVYFSGENLLTFTSLSKLFDPETLGGGYDGWGNSYPLSRTFSCGINVTF